MLHPFARSLERTIWAVGIAGLLGRAVLALPTAVLEEEEAKLVPTDGSRDGQVGASVSVGRDRAILGAPTAEDRGDETGVAYLFERSAGLWLEAARLTGSDSLNGDQFGVAVSIAGDRAVVGAPFAVGENAVTGAIYVFERSGEVWLESQKLSASDGLAGDEFGRAVGVSANTIAVGAPGSDPRGIESGSVYIYFFNGMEWVEQSKLTADDGSAMDRFGHSLALEEDHLLIGAPYDDDLGEDAGAAYFFDRIDATWFQFAKLRASDAVGESFLGYATALSADTALVGAYGDDGDGADSGAAYVFRNLGNGWNLEARLTPREIAPGDELGYGVALDGDLAVVGARSADPAGENGGAAFRFERSGELWFERETLLASDSASSDEFGRSVALSATTAVVGAPHHAGTGAAYSFEAFRTEVLPDPLEPGADATFTMTGGRPLETTFLALSLVGPGDTEIEVAGVKLDLESPFLGAARVTSDLDGVATFVVSIPPSASGRALWFQGVQLGWKTNLGSTVVE